MANSDGSVEVRITGSIDPSLAASAQAAKASIADMGATTTVSAAAMSKALQSVGGDLSKITPEMLGMAGAADTAAASTVGLAVATKSADAAQSAFLAKLASGRSVYELQALVHEALSGRFSRMAGTLSVEASRLGLLAPLFTATGLAIGGVVAAVGTLTAAYILNEAEERKLTLATVGLGAASGVTADQLDKIALANKGALQVGYDYRSSIAENRAALEAYTAAGVSNTDTLKKLTQTTDDFAALTGQKTKEAVKELARAMEDPDKGAKQLNSSLSLLDSTQLEAIQSAVNLGEKEKAQAILVQALKERDDEASAATGGLASAMHSLCVGATDAVDQVGGLIKELYLYIDVAARAKVESEKLAQAESQRKAELTKLSAAGVGLVGETPEGKAQAEREKRQGDVTTVRRALGADILLHGEHSDAVRRDREALAEYTRAAETYLSPIEKKVRLDELDVKLAAAKHAHNKALVDDLTRQKSLISQAGVVESAADAARLSQGAGDVAGARTHAGRGAKGPGIVSEWTEQLHQQEVASNDFFGDQTEKELAFWQGKLALTKKGSKDWLEVQSKIYEAQKKLAKDSYDDHLATLNEQLEVDRDNWSKEKTDWNAKLAFIKAHFGEESREYKDAYREFEAAEREHQHVMAQIAKAGAAEQLAELKSNLATQRSIRQENARAAESLINENARGTPIIGEVKAAQQIAALHKQLAQQEIADAQATYAAEDALRQQDVASALAAFGKDSAQYHTAINAKKLADQEFYNQHRQLENQMVNQEIADQQKIKAAWHSTIDPMISTTGNQFKGLIEGTETWGQALRNVGEEALTLIIEAIERMVEQWIVNMIVGQAATQTSAKAQGLAYAGVAGAAGVASMAAAPFPIDLGAPAFGAAMFADALGFAAFDKGTNLVPADMIAQVHAGERIIPAADNRQLMSAVNDNRSTSNGDIHNHNDFSTQINGTADTDVIRALKGRTSDLARILKDMHRDGHFRFAS